MRIILYIISVIITFIWFFITYKYFTSGVYEYSMFGSTVAWPSLLLLAGLFAIGYFWGRVFCNHVSLFTLPTYQEENTNTPIYNFSHVHDTVSTGDDLKVIEGVGPKLEKLLQENGYTTLKSISLSNVSDLEKVIESAGNKFAMHNPKTWPEQAKLAHAGKWEELKEYQNFLYRGLDS